MSKNSFSDSSLMQFVFTLIGSIPTIYICVMCAYMFHQDYELNRNTYWGQSKFFSMIEKFEYYENVTCAPNEYNMQKYATCAPKYCARYFTDKVISDKEADVLLKLAKKLLNNSESNSYYEFNKNKLYSQSFSDKNEISDNKHELTDYEVKIKNGVVNKIIDDIKNKLKIDDIKPTYGVLFQKIQKTTVNNYKQSTKFDKSLNDGIYYTATVYLNDHQIDYYGGRFQIDDYNKPTFLSVEPKKARLFVYTSGIENKNEIEEVFRGQRFSFTVYFTCDSNRAI